VFFCLTDFFSVIYNGKLVLDLFFNLTMVDRESVSYIVILATKHVNISTT